ncbi:MAG: response regulator [Candidatus Sumerlaeaceae bacterium]
MAKVLVCDDDPDLRYMIRYFLEKKGITVIEAENGKQAIEALAGRDFDALVIDLLMPIQDGYTTVSEVREDNDLKELPIIVLSSLAQEANVLRAFQVGASDFLKKPFSPEELYARLSRFLPGI